MIKIEIHNEAGKSLDKSFLRKVAKKTFLLSGRSRKSLSLSVALVGKRRIRIINRTWRKRDKPTDVLSFNYSPRYNKKEIEGEIILCPEIIKKEAERNGTSFKKELACVLAHGILHILGMKHGKKMFELQDKVSGLKS